MSFYSQPLNVPIGQHLRQAQAAFNAYTPPTMSLNAGIEFNAMAQSPTSIQSFSQVMSNTAQNINSTIKAPDALVEDYMRGGPTSIHEVMIASSKAELAVTMTSRTLTKVIQAYDKISQIQV